MLMCVAHHAEAVDYADPELLADRAFLLDAVVTNPDVLVAGLHAWPGNRWRGFG